MTVPDTMKEAHAWRDQPTFTFIGVTTRQSSSMRTFPRWVEALGRPEVVIEGVDFKLHDTPERYRQVVTRIKEDPMSLGGLVTTHKIDLLDASRDLFDALGPYAQLLGEISSISKKEGRLIGHATDPVAGGNSMDALLGPGYFGRTGGDVLCIGAGGAAAALALHLINKPNAADRPHRFVLVNRSQPRLDRIDAIVSELQTDIHFVYHCHENPAQNDALMAEMPNGSVVINATGMGKDRPGSPITDAGLFPQDGVAWELNYRGALDFMHQARAQPQSRNVHVEDGWVYFIHGWTQVISHVLHVDITPPLFQHLADLAAEIR